MLHFLHTIQLCHWLPLLDHLYLPHYKSSIALLDMHHLTCGIGSLLRSVNLILFTLLLVHLILCTPPHHSLHIRCHHLSLSRPFTPDLKLICFTNPFIHSLSTLGLLSRILDLDRTQWRLHVLISSCLYDTIRYDTIAEFNVDSKARPIFVVVFGQAYSIQRTTLSFSVHVKLSYCTVPHIKHVHTQLRQVNKLLARIAISGKFSATFYGICANKCNHKTKPNRFPGVVSVLRIL